jgi:VIT1/CCC1 family predicted Fe2+/Mn2+ transporter
MPHLFANRSRKFALLKDEDKLGLHMAWQWVSAFLYIIGGILLVVGSVLFLPKYEEYAVDGSSMFLVASIIYLWVSAHDIMEVLKAPREEGTNDLILDLTAGLSYAIGAILFIIGSIFFLPESYHAIPAAWCFIIGSLLFDVGACVNAVQIW